MAGKISKDKKKYIIAGISGILVIILILTAYSINSAKNDKKPTTDVSVEDSDKKVKSQSSASSDGGRVASTVEIEFEDSAVLVGTRFKVTAIVTPSDTDKALLWSSSDDSVFSVDENGIVTVKGTGNAVLTRTSGGTGRTPCWTTWSTKAIFSPPRPRPGSTGPTRAACVSTASMSTTA